MCSQGHYHPCAYHPCGPRGPRGFDGPRGPTGPPGPGLLRKHLHATAPDPAVGVYLDPNNWLVVGAPLNIEWVPKLQTPPGLTMNKDGQITVAEDTVFNITFHMSTIGPDKEGLRCTVCIYDDDKSAVVPGSEHLHFLHPPSGGVNNTFNVFLPKGKYTLRIMGPDTLQVKVPSFVSGPAAVARITLFS